MEIVASYVPGGDSAAVELARPPAGATMVEIRADLLGGETDVAALVAASPLPAIVTLRSRSHGGAGTDDPAERERFFTRWAGSGAIMFDLEHPADTGLLDRVVPRQQAVLSLHLPSTPDDVAAQARALLGSGAGFVKLVTTAAGAGDVVAVLAALRSLDEGTRGGRRAIMFASGEPGRATRLLAPLLGAPIAYASWGEGRAAAAGQYTPSELLSLVGHLQAPPRRLFAVVGSGVGSSLSPRMHAAAFRELGLPDAFVPLDVADEHELDMLLVPAGESVFDGLGLAAGGFAVTMPWKEAAARRCTLLAPRARRARAVNTVLPRTGKVLGDTTDIDGIVGLLSEEGVDLHGAASLVLGTGGSARAAAVGLDLAGAEVTIAGRDAAGADALARELGLTSAGSTATAAAIVVNATPAGADGEPSAWLDGLAGEPGTVVVDLPYGSGPTRLETLAGERRWRYLGGREVLLYQGIAQFAAMHGMAPPVRAMAAALGLEDVQG